jgi:hypothetical protein
VLVSLGAAAREAARPDFGEPVDGPWTALDLFDFRSHGMPVVAAPHILWGARPIEFAERSVTSRQESSSDADDRPVNQRTRGAFNS